MGEFSGRPFRRVNAVFMGVVGRQKPLCIFAPAKIFCGVEKSLLLSPTCVFRVLQEFLRASFSAVI